jgi:hypothetical protein
MALMQVSDALVLPLPTKGTTAGGGSLHPGYVIGKIREVRIRVDYSATESLAYPSSGGIPLPTYGTAVSLIKVGADASYGMVRNLDYLQLDGWSGGPSGTPGNRIHWQWNINDHALRGYAETGATSTADAAPTFMGELPTTWNVSEASGSATHISFFFTARGW